MEENLTGQIIKIEVGPIILFGAHGVYPEEKKLPREFEIVVKIDYFFKEKFLDYTLIVDIVKNIFYKKVYDLLEDMALDIKNEILNYDYNSIPIEKVKVKITKKKPPIEHVEQFSVEV